MSDIPAPRKNASQLPGLDVLKFCMACVVVSIHTHLFREIGWLHFALAPLKSSAVPVFFVVSSYLFFRKSGDWKTLPHYLGRLSAFYAFWFLFLLPVTVVIQRWHLQFDVADFFKCLFLGSTFRGSYFIMALMLGVPVVMLMHKWIHPLASLFVSFASYVVFHCQWWLEMPWGRHSFLAFLLWIDIGALLASSPLPPAKFLSPRLLGLPLLYGGMLASFWAPLLRPAFVVMVFAVFLDFGLRPRPSFLTLRKMGILIFVTHFIFADAAHLLAANGFPALDNSVLQYAVVLGCAALVSWAILKLQAKPFFGWLKYGM